MFVLYNFQAIDAYIELICVSNDKKKLEQEKQDRLIASDKYRVILQAYVDRSALYYEQQKALFKQYWLRNVDAIKDAHHLGYVDPEIIRSEQSWAAHLMCRHMHYFIEGSPATKTKEFIKQFIDISKLKEPLINIKRFSEVQPVVVPIYNEDELFIDWIQEL